MIRRTLTTVALAGGIVAGTAGVASAHGVTDPATTPYCGPTGVWVGANGDANGCAQTELGPDAPDDAGVFGALAAAWGIAWLVF